MLDTVSKQSTSLPTEKEIDLIVEEKITNYFDAQTKALQKKEFNALEMKYALASNDSSSRIYGEPSARITMRLFGDIECPFCREMHPELKRIVDNSQGVINWEYVHFPLSIHNPSAAKNAQTIECVAEEYGNKVAWGALEKFITHTKGNGKGIGNIPDFVRSFGLNGRLIELCINSDRHKESINADFARGKQLNISTTPVIQLVDNQKENYSISQGYKTAEVLLEDISNLLRR